jgi:hypothetical protein
MPDRADAGTSIQKQGPAKQLVGGSILVLAAGGQEARDVAGLDHDQTAGSLPPTQTR